MGIRTKLQNGLVPFRRSHAERHLAQIERSEIDPFLLARINQQINRGHPFGRAAYCLDWHAITTETDKTGEVTGYTLEYSMHHDNRNKKRVHGSIAYYVIFGVSKDDNGQFVPTRVAGMVGREDRHRDYAALIPTELTFITRTALENSLAIVRSIIDQNGESPDASRESRDILRRAIKKFIKDELSPEIEIVHPNVASKKLQARQNQQKGMGLQSRFIGRTR